ncbi:sulfurtransferase-like selenium metabolism protein YedF [Caldanaerobacter subterraneus]|uniref:Selenium metabolism protein YedF n=2 Tax=Caldanaerobacter subterraneus TaxID=911092 RepID=U5CT26_CALSX|nr:sulfurtransferase-like selenium metabolism protein YedF [Caldanaerobacter subterraneus]ERM93123.1 selenium metabolism protein YedF [Caldanaerobacter subterraneus subsp. yonseiensis KB-1]NNG66613.1 sulfurtransferase-like selenium metabolism protein YedF [Caldanaerobacter subterraneus]
MDNIVDARGKNCPIPVIMTKKALENIQEGKILVIVDNETAKENVSKYAKSAGCEVAVEEKEKEFYINIYKKKTVINEKSDNYVVVVTSDKFGEGDERLGKILMKSFIVSLKEQSKKPESIIFINNGVKLTTEGSEVIEDLKELMEMGVEIISCGTCLDFYGIKEKLLVGSISNMYSIAEKMTTLRTIRV